MEGGMDEWVCEWVDGWVNEWMDDRWVDRWTNGWWIDGGWFGVQRDGCVNE